MLSEGDLSCVTPGENVNLEENLEVEEFDEEETQVTLSAVETLPDEILVNIFQFLPFITKISVLPEVCQKWKIIASDFSVFPTTFDFGDIPAQSINSSMNFIFDIMKTKGNLRTTKLILPRVDWSDNDKCKTIVNLLETGSNLGVWKSLTKLSAREININEEVFTNFISSLNSEIFTELSIIGMTPQKMYSICRHLTKLQRFMIWDDYPGVYVESLQHLVNAGSDMKYLRELHVHVQDGDPVDIVTNILKSYVNQLELLTLEVVNIDSSFMESLGFCRKLIYLNVWLPYVEYDELCRTLSSLTQLEQLHLVVRGLTGSRTSEDSLFQKLKNLRHVRLWIGVLQDKDVTDLCINCGHCLETIDLVGSLADTAVTSIVTYCNKLVALKLEHCKNTNFVKLFQKLRENPENYLPQLVLLNLILWRDENEIPRRVLSSCLTARPQLFIKMNNNSIDEISASSVLHKILGPNCHHRKCLIRKLMI